MQEFEDVKTIIIVGVVMPILFVLAMFFLISCSSVSVKSPVVILSSEVKVGNSLGKHSIAGTYFQCVNISEYDIKELVISYDLFDMSQKVPKFIRHCEAVFTGYFEKGESNLMVHSLDKLINSSLISKYDVSNVFVKEIKFTDSSVWSNGGWIIG